METLSKAKAALKAISVFFYSMIGGLLMFTIIIFVMSYFQPPPIADKSVFKTIFIVVLFMAAISLSAAKWLYGKRIAAAQATGLSLMEKLTIYRGALMLYLALCEGAGLFAVIVYFLTGNKLLLAVVGVLVIAMLLKRPEKSKIFNELQLNSQEQLELN
jgi:hypothetical protein